MAEKKKGCTSCNKSSRSGKTSYMQSLRTTSGLPAANDTATKLYLEELKKKA